MKKVKLIDSNFNIIEQLNQYVLLDNKNQQINLVKSANKDKELFLLINIGND